MAVTTETAFGVAMPVTWGGGLEPPALWVPPLPEVPTVAPPDVPAALPVVADPARVNGAKVDGGADVGAADAGTADVGAAASSGRR